MLEEEMPEIELQIEWKIYYIFIILSYILYYVDIYYEKNCFVFLLVVTGATDGIGKAYAKEVM